MQKTLLIGLALFFIAPAQAQLLLPSPKPKPAAAPVAAMAPAGQVMPPGYLTGKPPVDILKLLPPPPRPGSAQDIADRAAYVASAAGIGGPEWQAAIGQLSPSSPEFVRAISCAIGTQLSLAATPATMIMVARAGIDMISPMTKAKDSYARPRPFTTDASEPGGGKACDPISNDGVGARLGYAYPSGHAGIGWLWALILSDAAPARADAIRSFGMVTGDLRIACRVHWLSDVANGRILATSVYQRIAAEPEYQADLKRAIAEIAAAPPLSCPG